ncbi:MAG: hypothetical protein A2219_03375 [Elusimicrobia bacterium RIFOXYA2_FULL_50_26]|nr:MAG: hypothetical protein A2219_03375 [Elusimicrobia bacterium RIFOXYA2_FULL_50_26]OGS22239.1 MAG: hypothetical protein A2314_01380 [Elusimicrobia bacterium RIFOXYB2_FULL_50_12]
MKKSRILVVDDDESVLDYIAMALQVDGFEVSVSATATQALGKLRAAPEPYPVVLTDISMPGINGIEFLRIIKKEYPETVVVMLTANASMESAVKSLNEGAFAYLTKPLNLEEMRATMKNACEKYSLSRQNKELVSELQKAKEYLETIVQSLVYIVVATDSEGYIRKTNKAVETLLGYTEAELKGAPLAAILSPEFRQASLADLSGGRVRNFPVTFLAKDGRTLRLSFTGTIMKDAKGKVIGFLGTAGS